MIVQVVIPYNPDIPRPGQPGSQNSQAYIQHQHQSPSLRQARNQRASPIYRDIHSSDTLDVVSPVSRSKSRIREETRTNRNSNLSESLSMMRKRGAASVIGSASLPIDLRLNEEGNGEDDLVSSSPMNVQDISDSLSLKKNRRNVAQNPRFFSSSPVYQASQRKHKRTLSQSQLQSQAQSQVQHQYYRAPQSRNKRNALDLVRALELRDGREVYAIMREMPVDMVQMLNEASSQDLNLRKKQRLM